MEIHQKNFARNKSTLHSRHYQFQRCLTKVRFPVLSPDRTSSKRRGFLDENISLAVHFSVKNTAFGLWHSRFWPHKTQSVQKLLLYAPENKHTKCLGSDDFCKPCRHLSGSSRKSSPFHRISQDDRCLFCYLETNTYV